MMKRLTMIALALCFATATVIPAVSAADAKKKPAKAAKKKTPQKDDQVLQGELACKLVDVLGLRRFLAGESSGFQCANVLSQNGVTPPKGWELDKVVDRGTLAVLLVAALDAQDQVKDPTNPAQCVALLQQMGVDMTSIGTATDNVDALDEPVATHVAKVATDPLKKSQHKYNPVDERQGGVDMGWIVRRLDEVAAAAPVQLPFITQD